MTTSNSFKFTNVEFWIWLAQISLSWLTPLTAADRGPRGAGTVLTLLPAPVQSGSPERQPRLLCPTAAADLRVCWYRSRPSRHTTSAPGEDDLPHHSWSNITALTWLYLQVLAKVLKSGIWRRLYKWVVGKCEIWYIPSLYFIINARKIDIDRNALYVKCHVQCLHVLCRIIKVLCFGNL